MADEPDSDRMDVNLGAALGAGASSVQCFSIYIPNKDRDGYEIGNQRKWVLEAIQLLTEINGGATAMPPAEGGWMDTVGEIVWENPVVVYSFIQVDKFDAAIPRLRTFVHRLGRETNQGEIAFEFQNRFFRVRSFDPA